MGTVLPISITTKLHINHKIKPEYTSESNQHLKIKHPDLFRTLGNYLSGNNSVVKESQEEDESL